MCVIMNDCLIIAGQYSLLDEFIKRIGGGSSYWVIKLYGPEVVDNIAAGKNQVAFSRRGASSLPRL